PWRASSPTWGPLPWDTTSSWARATGARASQAMPTLARWFSWVMGSPRRRSALPPSATTTLTSPRPSASGAVLGIGEAIVSSLQILTGPRGSVLGPRLAGRGTFGTGARTTYPLMLMMCPRDRTRDGAMTTVEPEIEITDD